MVSLHPFSLVVGLLALTASASAQPLDPRETRARTDCLTGKVESGVALLAELFTETGNSNFIYNQARCYEQNNRPADAISRFREYLRVAKGISDEDRLDSERHIAECRQLITDQDSIRHPAEGPTQPSGEGTGEVGRRLRIAGWLVGGLGVLAVGTGGIFSLLVKSTQQKVESDAHNRTYDPSLDSRGRTYNTLQWVSYGVGPGLVAVGGIFYAFGHVAGKRETTVRVDVEPTVAPGLSALAVKARF